MLASRAIPRMTAGRLVAAARVANRRLASSGAAPQPPTPQSTAKRNAVVAGVLLAASAAVYYYESSEGGVVGGKPKHEFTVDYRVGRGRESATFTLKDDDEIKTMLTEHETSFSPLRNGDPVSRWDSNFVAANEPCEDRSAVDVIPRGPIARSWYAPAKPRSDLPDQPGKRDLVLVSVFDGHAGDATSKLLARTLHPTLSLALAGLQAGIVPGRGWYDKLGDTLAWSNIWSPPNVVRTLQAAFVQLDENICETPLKLLPGLTAKEEHASARAQFVALAAPATHGAVAGTAVVDAENEALYVAVTGDVRAVAGWQSTDGSWRCDTLSEDQMGDNPAEVARMRAEHPAIEADTVIRHGRVQGALQPTRAFGDAIYKWKSEYGNAIAEVFRTEGEKARPARAFNFTPPYVTARPEVTHRQLKQGDEKLKFLVIATDGLWDRITSEEATLLMAGYMKHPKRADVSKTTLANELAVATTEPRPYPADELPGTGKRAQGYWAFEGDDNAATHLMRNAFGGGDRKLQAELLSLNGKVARYFRDDMTVTVVFFNE